MPAVSGPYFDFAAKVERLHKANSPDQANEIMGAVMDALTAHTAMSKQALESAQLRADLHTWRPTHSTESTRIIRAHFRDVGR